MKKEYLRYGLSFVLVVCLFGLLASCGPGPGNGDEEPSGVATTAATTTSATTTSATTTAATTTGTTTTTEAPPPEADSISLGADQVQVLSDNTDFATITATVLDQNNVVMEDVEVVFSATGGVISPPPPYRTDANGEAQIAFRSGSSDWSNRFEFVTATVGALAPVQMAMLITGSTLELSSNKTSVPENDASGSATLTITARNAKPTIVPNASVTVSQSGATGNGQVVLTPPSGTTDLSGELVVDVAGGPLDSEGTATVLATWGLASSSIVYTVVDTAAAVFEITLPVDDPYSYNIGDGGVTIQVEGVTGGYEVVFATSLGIFDGTADVVTKAEAGGIATASFDASETGTATIQVFEKEPGVLGEYTGQTDSLTIAVTSPVADAARIDLQSTVTDLPLSAGGLEYSTQLTATVTDSTGINPVGGAPVQFSIENATGGGETVSPVLVFTDDSGKAITTFTSGSSASSGTGVTIVATVVGEGTAGPSTNVTFNDANPDTIVCTDCDFLAAPAFEDGEQVRVSGAATEANNRDWIVNNVPNLNTLVLDGGEALTAEASGASVTIVAVSTSTNITISAEAGSVTIGGSTKIGEDDTHTYYEYDLVVMVADAVGHGVPDQEVTVTVWPIQYSTGYWFFCEVTQCWETCIAAPPGYTPCSLADGTFDNEDANEDTVLQPAEDIGSDPGHGDGFLTPHNADGGVIVQETLITDEYGIATFTLRYPKRSAIWIVDRIRASTMVGGTETTSTYILRLVAELVDACSGALSTLEDDGGSPYNNPSYSP